MWPRLLVQIVLVAFGSALGGLTRWGVAAAAARWLGAAFPWGTFFINISGSFFLGWFLSVLSERYVPGEKAWLRPDDLRLLLAVGFCGAYTTFSTYAFESQGLLADGDGLAGTLYMLGSVLIGLLAVRLGILLGRQG
jgi:CrcB protein